MLFYIDSCVVISATLTDDHTEKVTDWLLQRRSSELITSEWTLTEIASALGNFVRRGELDHVVASEKWLDIQALLNDEFKVESILPSDFRNSTRYMQDWEIGLRAGDALHLSVANRLNLCLVTTDATLVKAAKHINVSVFDFKEDK
jgi:uncharacterized protein